MEINYLKFAAMSTFLLIPLSATAVHVPPAQISCVAPDGSVHVCSVLCGEGPWADSTTGYQVRSISELVCSANCHCKISGQEYRCADGYYGRANKTGTSGCTKCPCLVDVTGVSRCGSVAANNGRGINDCKMSSSSYIFQDSFGTYQFDKDCPY
jgi:hypothetical protein